MREKSAWTWCETFNIHLDVLDYFKFRLEMNKESALQHLALLVFQK